MNALNNASILEPTCKGFASFSFPEAKSSKTGVSVDYAPSPDKAWYVIRTLYGHAQQVADMVVEKGDYAYLAMIWKDEWREGKRHRVLRPLMNLLFAYVTKQQAEYYVKESVESRGSP